MKKSAPDTAEMFRSADAVILVEPGPTEVRILLFRRKKQREKRRR